MEHRPHLSSASNSPAKQHTPQHDVVSPHVGQRTSSRHAVRQTDLPHRHAPSPPSTPPNPARRRPVRRDKGKQPLRAHANNIEGARPQDRGGAGSDETYTNTEWTSRHSHGLSWSSTTRDSVVDNLLLSLDNFSNPNLAEQPVHPNYYETDKFMLPPNFFPMNKPAQRPRGHTYSSSSTSEYGTTIPESPGSTLSGQRSRRSNSSSNFGNSKVHPAHRARGIARSSSETQRPSKPAPPFSRAPAGRNSEDQSNDLGYEAVLESSRMAFNGRSVSMDQIYSDSERANLSMMQRGRPVPSVYSKYDAVTDENACPEPSVASGPRRMLNPSATGPVYVNQAPPKQSALRKITTQSDLRSQQGRHPSPIPTDIRNQASDFVRASSLRGPMPAIPPAPDHNTIASSPPATGKRDTASPVRERPGFFKRVFGGGRSSTISPTSQQQVNANRAQQDDTQQRSHIQGNGHLPRSRAGTPVDMQSRPGTTATTQATPALNKKPSSFFRRRKKSTSELLPVPALPNDIARVTANVQKAEPSPSASSLRKALDPFLSIDQVANKPISSGKENERPNTSESSTSDDLDIFHSGYTPPPDASLGRRNPISREPSLQINRKPSKAEDARMRVKKRKPEPLSSLPTSHPSESIKQGSVTRTAIPQSSISPISAVYNDKEITRVPSRASTGDLIIASEDVASNGAEQPQNQNSNEANYHASSEGFVIANNTRLQERPDSRKSGRLFLQPTESEEKLDAKVDTFPAAEGFAHPTTGPYHATARAVTSEVSSSRNSPSTTFHSAHSLPLVQLDGNDVPRQSVDTAVAPLPTALLDEGAEYHERARKIFEGDEEDVLKAEAAGWLGERNTLSSRTLNAYMQLFDFSGQNVLTALRTLCGNLILKGESQQFDRIITALSARWCICNPNNGFKAEDVVHTIFYSLILLNTDLHLADIGDKMTKSAYVKNTLPTIKRVVSDAAPGAFDDTVKPTSDSKRPSLPWANSGSSAPTSPALPPDTPLDRTSFDDRRPNPKRLSLRPAVARTDTDGDPEPQASVALVASPWEGGMRGWEVEIEGVLKSFYNSIRSEPLPLHGFGVTDASQPQSQGGRNLTVATLSLKRSGSVVSKAPSEAVSHRSKPDFKSMTMRWPGRSARNRPKVYASSTVASSRTSFDDGNSVWSPAQSSAWGSKYSLGGKSATATSLGSYGQHLSPTGAEFKHSIGFANALSQAIIREEAAFSGSVDSESLLSVPKGILEDEALALEGAPWAKEGLVKHKHHKEDAGHKSKDRNWNDCFAVISKGRLTLFAFNTETKSRSLGRSRTAAKGRAASVTAGRVGGGDWMENAEQLENFVLRQTIASVLPPPGYSKTRPHVWALHLPNGAIHLFHVGTPEIAQEFMTTANYWSARLSKEPLQGGVSNIEYGWSENVIDMALLEHLSSDDPNPIPPVSLAARQHGHSASNGTLPRPSTQSSLRASFDTGFADRRARLPGDKVQLAEWTPPSQSLMASQLLEVDQLRALQTYVANVESELEKHNELKQGIELAFSPRHPNYNKAIINWQRKSDYLLRENVKFRTYADSLQAAQKAKERAYSKRADALPTRGASRGAASLNSSVRTGSVSEHPPPQQQQQQQRPATTGDAGKSSIDADAWREWRENMSRSTAVTAGVAH